jgi:hypothetical protein
MRRDAAVPVGLAAIVAHTGPLGRRCQGSHLAVPLDGDGPLSVWRCSLSQRPRGRPRVSRAEAGRECSDPSRARANCAAIRQPRARGTLRVAWRLTTPPAVWIDAEFGRIIARARAYLFANRPRQRLRDRFPPGSRGRHTRRDLRHRRFRWVRNHSIC